MTQTGSARFEGDSWDLASSVGLTATMVAAARAVAGRAPGALVNDQFAEPLVRAVGVDFFVRMASGELDPDKLAEDEANGLRRFADAMAIRTHYFDNFFLDATRAGIRQAVILASGLDSRAYRLRWPAGTIVFEVDQPQVIDFKTTTLAGLGAAPTTDRRTVAVDLRDDWPTALQKPALTTRSGPPGSPRGCWAICPPRRRTGCLTRSPPRAYRAASSPPKSCATSIGSTKKNCGDACGAWRSGSGAMASTSTCRAWCISATARTRGPIWPTTAGEPPARAPPTCWLNTDCRRSTATTPRSAR